ncbi:protein ORF13 [Southern Psittacara leucophthalmus aviadenovirus]|uniref:Protein ORF13 n=1 Tax=Southern Psittacara leucophthalmus aviadenovirus TaxID=2604330 RepID=A0AAF1DB80_9ADEN|nr:protein ORF13 [Southern Psittacara leucophthalmus aviadenovirus]QEJ80764.2 protein ORF13 [Southern Psittacara leucophthalmus aviadenovirus]
MAIWHAKTLSAGSVPSTMSIPSVNPVLKTTSTCCRLLQSPTKRRATHSEEAAVPLVPESPMNSQNENDIVDHLFNEGVAHYEQWAFQPKTDQPTYERNATISALRDRFSKGVMLINQLPISYRDPIREAFYDLRDNWFYKLFEFEGYDPSMAARTITNWLEGDINTLVFCGSNLSNAKHAFNALASCFPFAVVDNSINSLYSLHKASLHASVYCVPFIDTPPSPAMLHIMEGNNSVCMLAEEPAYIRSMPMLLHCIDLSLAQTFVANNVAVFFMTGDLNEVSKYTNYRRELKDFVNAAAVECCHLTLHCKKNNPLCNTCINKAH